MPQPKRAQRNDADWTPHDHLISKNLRRIWEHSYDSLNLSQNKAAKKLAISQPAVSNYLNGVLRLNIRTILGFAQILDVEPHNIDPHLGYIMKRPKRQPTETTYQHAIRIRTTHYEPRILKGDLIILDTLNTTIRNNKLCAALNGTDDPTIGYLQDNCIIHPTTKEPTPLHTNAHLFRIEAIVPHDEETL